MNVEMRYGTGTLPIEIPDKNVAGVLEISESVPLSDEAEAVQDALARPIASRPFSCACQGACVSLYRDFRRDPSCPKQSHFTPPYWKRLKLQASHARKLPSSLRQVSIARNEGKELQEMVGREIMETYRIVNHFSQKPEHHGYLGKTQNGTPVYIDKTYLESDLKIITGLIEPHLMAGYSGGRKAVCPGVASIETMKVMHGPELMEHPKSAVGILDGNPFHIRSDGNRAHGGC